MIYKSFQFLVQIPLGTTELFLILLIRESLEVVSQQKPHQSSCYEGIHLVKMLSSDNVFSLLPLLFLDFPGLITWVKPQYRGDLNNSRWPEELQQNPAHCKPTPYRPWFHSPVVCSYQTLPLSPGSSFSWYKCFLNDVWEPGGDPVTQGSFSKVQTELSSPWAQRRAELGGVTDVQALSLEVGKTRAGADLGGVPAPARWFGLDPEVLASPDYHMILLSDTVMDFKMNLTRYQILQQKVNEQESSLSNPRSWWHHFPK